MTFHEYAFFADDRSDRKTSNRYLNTLTMKSIDLLSTIHSLDLTSLTSFIADGNNGRVFHSIGTVFLESIDSYQINSILDIPELKTKFISMTGSYNFYSVYNVTATSMIHSLSLLK